jgi:hypothetical protein
MSAQIREPRKDLNCGCGGAEFGVHRIDCPAKNGRYGLHYRRVGTDWLSVVMLLEITALVGWLAA